MTPDRELPSDWPPAEVIASLPDFSGEFSGYFDTAAVPDLFRPGKPTFQATITLNAPDGERYTQADADELVGKPVRADMFPGRAHAVAGTITSATAAEDGSEVVLVAEVSPE